MKIIKIFEPAMCCSTGLCGVGVNTELLRISTVLDTLKKKGVNIERYNLTSSPQAFLDNEKVGELLNINGVDILPIITLNGEIVITKRYPTNLEFVQLLGVSNDYLTSHHKNGGCCGGKGGCC